MSDAHGADLGAGAHEPHDADAPDGAHGHGHDGHGPAGGALGPLDWRAWGAGLLGVAIGLVVTFCFILATA